MKKIHEELVFKVISRKGNQITLEIRKEPRGE